jgi:FixJ family two-component response regulator
MPEVIPTVIVVDDDPAIRESIGGLLRSVGLQPKLLASVDEFLKAGRPDGPTCLVLPHREGEEPKPMMHGHEKSDSAIVA